MKEKQDFEEDLKRLQKIVDELSGGKLTLQDALKKYEEGVKLAQGCSAVLNDAQRKVDLLMKKEGKFSLASFEDKDEG
jgi:exodeoxyribonuclease VII small subunit